MGILLAWVIPESARKVIALPDNLLHSISIDLKLNSGCETAIGPIIPGKRTTMTLEQELADFRAEWERTAPEGRAALYTAKIEEWRAAGLAAQALGAGAIAPGFTLPNAQGRPVGLPALLRDGPAVIAFYRGGWCPYCNIQLRAYQKILPEIAALGGRLVAISPQSPDASLDTAEKNALAFAVLSDTGNAVARRFGLVFTLPDELQDAMRANGKLLPDINGEESWELPVPATYVVAADGRIALGHVEVDYRRRLEPEAILTALRGLKTAGSHAA
jgi:peroxiredoxin